MSSRRQELVAQLTLALPILGGQLAQTANGFVDTMMAGRVSANDLAAVAVGASIWVPLFLFMTGVLMSATPILSAILAAKLTIASTRSPSRASGWAWDWVFSPDPAQHRTGTGMDGRGPGHSPAGQRLSGCPQLGMPGAALMLAMRSYTESMNHTRPVLLFSVIGLLINIPSNYVLIYGKLGFPAMGGVGCGWATSLVMWSMALMMLFIPTATRCTSTPRSICAGAILKWPAWGTCCVWGYQWGYQSFSRSASLP